MKRLFETRFMEEAEHFLSTFDQKSIRKILFKIDLAEQTKDPKLFKKLQQDIWEFRINASGLQIRFLAFWDKSDSQKVLVLATHGFVKKTQKVPSHQISHAIDLMKKYFDE